VILPSKHLPRDRALLTVGAHVLSALTRPKTVSALWEEISRADVRTGEIAPKKISYDWFLLSLDLLYAFDAIDMDGGLVKRRLA